MVPLQGEKANNLHLYTGAMLRDLAVEQYDPLKMDQHSPKLGRNLPSEVSGNLMEDTQEKSLNTAALLLLLLPSK